jgi:starch phosphorylase
VYLEDYDIAIARALYQGADVWLNTPRRPLEACGTSGMKAALNGTLNCSTLDGWWDEWFDGANGWAIASAEQTADLAHRDQIEADSLFDLLENQIVPTFYVRSEGPVPRRWIARVKHDLASLGPKVVASRMVREYTTRLYEPAAAASDAALASGAAGAKALAAWKAGVLEGWPGVKILDVSSPTGAVEVGQVREVHADVVLDGLAPGDVQVQLVHGPVGPNDELTDVAVVPMQHAGTDDNGAAHYEGSFTCRFVGRYGFTVRVLPYHPGLQSPVELGRIAWA